MFEKQRVVAYEDDYRRRETGLDIARRQSRTQALFHVICREENEASRTAIAGGRTEFEQVVKRDKHLTPDGLIGPTPGRSRLAKQLIERQCIQ